MFTKKSLGQHFLHSVDIVECIVKSSEVKKSDTVVEIGPGEGFLTQKILDAGGNVVAIEKDDRLIPILKEKFAKEITKGRLTLVHTDVLTWDVSSVRKPYILVANIPYYITGQIIRMFLECENQPTSMTLLIQKEVAERITTRTSGVETKESLLSLSVKIFGVPKYIRTVGKGAFTPPPSVESAILTVTGIHKKRLCGLDEKFFFTVLHAGFAHKRKQLLPNLTTLYTKEILVTTFHTCGIDLKTRAEDVHIETWVKLCHELREK